jgi:hypothetical protein
MKTKRTKRTDVHRPGAIEPERYTYRGSYSLPTSCGGWPVPAIGVEHALAVAAEVHAAGHEIFGGLGKCGVCGACFSYGDIWQHEGGELVHLGHDCAAKYELIADRREWDRENTVMRERSAREHEQALRAERAERAVDCIEREHPGFAAAITCAASPGACTASRWRAAPASPRCPNHLSRRCTSSQRP